MEKTRKYIKTKKAKTLRLGFIQNTVFYINNII